MYLDLATSVWSKSDICDWVIVIWLEPLITPSGSCSTIEPLITPSVSSFVFTSESE